MRRSGQLQRRLRADDEVLDRLTAERAYDGSYRQQGTGRAILTPEGEEEVVSSFHLQPSATGTDGSRVRALLKGHVTVTPDGTVRVATDTLRCIQLP